MSSRIEPRITEYRLPPEKLKQARGLNRIRTQLYLGGTLYGIAVLVLLLALRLGARFRDCAEAITQRRWAQTAIFMPLLLISLALLELPLGLYSHHVQVLYGLSVQGLASWFGDWAKGELLGLILMTLLFGGLYSLLRRSPKRWWFYGWLILVPVIVLLVFLEPLVIAPLFNHFDSLEAKQPQLVMEIERVVQRGGMEIPRTRMFEMKASEKVTTYNAYVSGIGASKRVVVWDNTSRDLSIPQTLFIFGHEQGHYVLHHIWKGLSLAILGMLLMLYLAHHSIGLLLGRWGTSWGVRGVSDWASLPALLLLMNGFSVLAQPFGAGFSRYIEHQADIYGLEVIHSLVPDSSQAAAQAFQKLGEKGLAIPDPDPLFVFWTYSHPPIADRVRFALDYHPWDTGAIPKYVK